MTPIQAIESLADVLEDSPSPFTEDDVYAGLEACGVPTAMADRAYKFALLAAGRQFLGPLGITFMDDYVCFDAAGKVIESGNVTEESFSWPPGSRVTPSEIGAKPFREFALMSADVNAVNNALNADAPARLKTAPAFLFLEPPTDAGWARAWAMSSARYLAQMQAKHALARRDRRSDHVRVACSHIRAPDRLRDLVTQTGRWPPTHSTW
ncbi:MAG: hypothetical protein R3B96_22160 [Pirellulaceae bacterium]